MKERAPYIPVGKEVAESSFIHIKNTLKKGCFFIEQKLLSQLGISPQAKGVFMAKSQTNDPLAGGQEVKPTQVAFNKVGDWVKGVFTGFKSINGKNGPVNLYEVKGLLGEFHNADTTTDDNGNKIVKVVEPAVTVTEGDYFNIWGGKDVIDGGFKKAKVGQIVGIRFEKAVPSKKAGNSPFKDFRFILFGMDPDYMGETAADVQQVFPGAEEVN